MNPFVQFFRKPFRPRSRARGYGAVCRIDRTPTLTRPSGTLSHRSLVELVARAVSFSVSGGCLRRSGVLCGGILGMAVAFATVQRCNGAGSGSAESDVLQSLSAAPVYFEANHGQANCDAHFIARGRDFNLLLSPATAELVLGHPGSPSVTETGESKPRARTVQLQFAGANPGAEMSGAGELPGRANYLLGSDPARWRTGVPLFSRVAISDLYPGVHLVYYANRDQLEYDFQLQPGVDPGQIKFHVKGADAVRVDAAGELVLQVGDAKIREHKPVVYQAINGVRRPVAAGYRLADDHTVGFEIATYDRSQPLVIDPILSFSTYFGGTKGDIAWDVALDSNGYVYVVGETLSAGIATPGAYQPANAGSSHYNGDAFIAKFANGTSNLIYLTYLGGSDNDAALGVAVDASGSAFVTGFTDSSNFPVVNTTIQDHIAGHNNNARELYAIDAFVAKLSPDGGSLQYSTFLGGESREAGNSIAVDGSGSAYVTGFTESTNFPAIQTAPQHYQTNFGGHVDAFVAKIQTISNLASLAYCTYLGGTNQDNGEGISVDAAGCAYVTGFTLSTNFPTYPLNNSWFNGQTNRTSQYLTRSSRSCRPPVIP